MAHSEANIAANNAGANGQNLRRERMAILAQADAKALAKYWQGLGVDPQFTMPRAPQTGIVALRGRIGGGGDPFNFGEATVTRATVRLSTGEVGHAMALGRDHAKAKLSAVLDALAQSEPMAARIDAEIIAPLKAEFEAGDKKRAAQTAATKVDFFTVVRGED